METDKEDVVGEQHESSELVRDSALSEDIVTEVTDISDLRVLHDEFVHGD